MSKRSIRVENRIRNAEAVVASAQTHGPAIAAEAATVIGGLSAAQIEASIAGIAAALRASTDALSAAEDAYVAEQADDVPVRVARDAAVGRLLPVAVQVRARVEEVFGSDALEQYGLDGKTPRPPKALADHANNAIKLLRAQAREGADLLGRRLSTTDLADALAAELAPLTESLASAVTEAREHEAALTARDRAMEGWQRTYRGAATTLTGYYLLAGREDLADRIRPTVRREAGLEATPEEGEGEAGSEAGSEAAAGAGEGSSGDAAGDSGGEA